LDAALQFVVNLLGLFLNCFHLPFLVEKSLPLLHEEHKPSDVLTKHATDAIEL